MIFFVNKQKNAYMTKSKTDKSPGEVDSNKTALTPSFILKIPAKLSGKIGLLSKRRRNRIQGRSIEFRRY